MNSAITLPTHKHSVQYTLFLTHSTVKALKEEVSPPLYDSLEDIWKLLKNEILNPLSSAKNSKDFSQRVEASFPQFFNLRIAILHLLLSYYKDELYKFEDEIISSLSLFEESLENKAKKYFNISEELTLKSILFTIRGITTRVTQWSIKNRDKAIKWSDEIENLFRYTVLLELHLIFIFSIIEGEIKPYRKNLIKISLEQAKTCENKYFYYVKKLGILSPLEKKKIYFPKKPSVEAIKAAENSTKDYMKYLTEKLRKEDE